MKAKFGLLVALGLLGLLALGAGLAEARPPCPSGYHWSGRFQECRPNRPVCPPGRHWNGAACVPKRRPCPPGYHWSGRYQRCLIDRR